MALPPLVTKYFGAFLERLLKAIADDELTQPHFALVSFYPDALEQRLSRIEHLNMTGEILKEVGDKDVAILDKRLVNAWAEIRLIDQINSEHFSNIRKVTEIADVTATKDGKDYAFQVRRIVAPFSSRIEKIIKDEEKRKKWHGNNGATLAEIDEIYGEAIENYFWDPLQEKNDKFSKWESPDTIRCIVFVTSEDTLQDRVYRHVACQRIVKLSNYLLKRNFEELIWLPDTGNGAWFRFDPQGIARCYADWGDDDLNPFKSPQAHIQRRELDLKSLYPLYVHEQ